MVEFDEQLKNRLLAFQQANGLTTNGSAGTETWLALVSAGGAPATSPAKPKRLKNGELNGVKLVSGQCNHPDHPADVLSAEAVAQLAKDAGFTGNDLVTAVAAVAVAMAESGLNRTCYSASHDVGLWQINQVNWPAFGGKDELYKAKENAEAAHQLYTWAKKSFQPWVAFKNDSCKSHLTAAKAAVSAISAKPAPKANP